MDLLRHLHARAVPVGLAVALSGILVPGSPAMAVGCTEAHAVLGPTVENLTRVRLMVPEALSGRAITVQDLSAARGANAVRVVDVLRPGAALIDVAVVLDTASDLPPVQRQAVTDAALGLVSALPAATRVLTVAAGGSPRVLSALSANHASATAALTHVTPGPGHAISDAVVLALGQLPAEPTRYRHLVVIGAGKDASTASDAALRSALTRYQPTVQVLDVGQGATYPDAGAQCPASVPAGGGREAGRSVATRIRSEVRVLLQAVAAPTEATVRIRTTSPVVDDTVRIEPAAMQLMTAESPADKVRAWLAGTSGRVALACAALLFLALLGFTSRPARRTLHTWRVRSARQPKAKNAVEGLPRLSLTEALERVTGEQPRPPRAAPHRGAAPAEIGWATSSGDEDEHEQEAPKRNAAAPEPRAEDGLDHGLAPADPAHRADDGFDHGSAPADPAHRADDGLAPADPAHRADDDDQHGTPERVPADPVLLPAPSAADRVAQVRRLSAQRVAAQRAAARRATAEAGGPAPPEATLDLREDSVARTANPGPGAPTS